MTDTAPDLTCLTLVSRADRRALAVTTPGPPRLPEVRLRAHAYFGAKVPAAFRDAHALDANLLRRLRYHYDRDTRVGFGAYELEARHALPAGLRWAERDELEAMPAGGATREVLRAWLDDARAEAPTNRPAWARHGWRARAEAWIDARLEERGARRTGELEPVKQWSISALYRLETTMGGVYFKAVPAFMRREPAVTAWLAERFPDRAPAVIAATPDGLMLLRDAGAATPEGAARLDAIEAAVRDFAALQRHTSEHHGELRALGADDRGTTALRAHLSAFLADTPFLEDAGLDAGEIARLRALEPRFLALAGELEAPGVPLTLVHGDLHLGNILLRDDSACFIDWSDASIAHPFLDPGIPSGHLTPDDAPEDFRDRLIAAYLEPWADLAPPDRLRAALDAAGPLGELHRVATYHRAILAGVEDKEEWRAAPAWHLRAVLRQMHA